MAEIKNYKNFRKVSSIWGMSVFAFFVFMGVLIGCLLTLLTGISFFKIILIFIVVSITYLICLIGLSNPRILDFLTDEKLPKKKSSYE